MTPDDPIPTESITRLARRLLRTIDDTPIAAMDATSTPTTSKSCASSSKTS